jgi:Uma2 family endonuclease
MAASVAQIGQQGTIAPPPQWKPATWEEYELYRDQEIQPPLKRWVFFDRNALWVLDMAGEGVNHATIVNLLVMLLGFWFAQHPGQVFSSMGGCILEKPNLQAAVPDVVLYLGEDHPRWEKGEPRRVNLTQWRVPNLVCEVADTTLATDLDEKKKLYAAMGIPEYWVINVQGGQVFFFLMQADGTYQQCTDSLALTGLPLSLLEQTLEKLSEVTNGSAALWFSQQIAHLKLVSEVQTSEDQEAEI